MTEEFLQFIWKFRLFDNPNLYTSCNQPITIISPGVQNKDSGPDFINAKVKIGETLWAGNIEIHINSSDWNRHNHQHDKAYDSVILHVVFNNDTTIKRANKGVIPTLKLQGNIPEHLYANYIDIIKNKDWVPCKPLINQVEDLILNSWLERLLIERLERKSEEILNTADLNKNSWEQTFYQYLAKNFGFKINDVPFELLAKSLPQKHLAKHRNNPFQLEAMLLGQAGLLNTDEFNDDYPNLLQKEYKFLKNKFSLQPIDSHLWKFMRTRPVNFPTIRISQFADLVSKSAGLFASVIETRTIDDINILFDIKTSSYWETHYVFDKKTSKRTKNLGQNSIQNIIINTVVPFMFAYSFSKDKPELKQRALNFLYETKKESNTIIKNWEASGIKVKNAFVSQALIELKNEYCKYKRCLDCQIGNTLIKSN